MGRQEFLAAYFLDCNQAAHPVRIHLLANTARLQRSTFHLKPGVGKTARKITILIDQQSRHVSMIGQRSWPRFVRIALENFPAQFICEFKALDDRVTQLFTQTVVCQCGWRVVIGEAFPKLRNAAQGGCSPGS